jgi:hypothetical protein
MFTAPANDAALALGEQLVTLAQKVTATPAEVDAVLKKIDALSPAPRAVALTHRDISGRSALHHACLLGKSAIAKSLVQREEVDLLAQDGQGQTALHLALKCTNEAAKSQSSAGSSASNSNSHADCANAILDAEEKRQGKEGQESAPKKAKLDDGGAASASTAASSAATTPSSASVLTLRDSFGRLPLHWSVPTHSLLFRCLRPELVNAQTQSGDTPLHWAASDADLPALDILLSAGAECDLKNGRGETPEDVARDDATKGVLRAWRVKREAQEAAEAAARPAADADAGTVSASSLMRSTGGAKITSAAPKKKTAIKMKMKPTV